MPLRLALILLLLTPVAAQAELPYVNWENHPVHALDLSPDGAQLAVAHTADQRVQLFAIGSTGPVPAGHVMVGVDPVAVRFRGNAELWAVNHLSDSISVIDPLSRQVKLTLATGDEPFDVVFAAGRAFVSCSQVNQVWVYELADLSAPPRIIDIAGEDPRALAVSADGASVAVAIFESGNASTVLGGGLESRNPILAVPNAVSDPRGPYGGQNPPPNAGSQFDPPINAAATPPPVGLIVRRGADQRWRDDNQRDWTAFVSGDLSSASGRRAGWTLPDRDLAIIDASRLTTRHESGLMNIGMALAVNPGSGQYTLIGTDASNEVRFEPKVRGSFVQVKLARTDRAGGVVAVGDLNPHLDYRQPQLAQPQRDLSLGDPRAIVWSSNGERGWVAGLGSNNVIEIAADGARRGAPIRVGEGPIGLALDESRAALYVWNHFEASLSVLDINTRSERQRIEVFNPLPAAIRAGRRFLYDTQLTSGLGQASCASCHIDGRMDRLAWDLGDPSQPPQVFDQNCVTENGRRCENFHAMKGPMTTQTLQDIIGHEPHHWRGDRAGIEAFNPAFEGLLGDDRQLSDSEMQAFEDFLATLAFPPNPNRAIDNSLPSALPLTGHYTSGRFSVAGQPLPPGNAVRGLQLFTQGLLDPPFQCANCHTLPTGMAANGPMFVANAAISAGGAVMPMGPFGENHLGIVSTDGSTNVSIKVAQLRNQHEKVGFDAGLTESRAGFGFLHDGSVDSLSRFLSASVFTTRSDQDIADLVALTLAFSGSDFALANPLLGGAAPLSNDTHAGVGQQTSHAGGARSARLDALLAMATSGKVDLIARRPGAGYAYRASTQRFVSDDGSSELSVDALLALANAAQPLTFTVVPVGLADRLGRDRDGDGVGDALEVQQGSDPTESASKALRPAQGLWFNPDRAGHGFDLQAVGDLLALTWYTYDQAGLPVWYQAVGPAANPFRADLLSYRWNHANNSASSTTAGSLSLHFDSARRGRFDWTLGSRSGSERVQPLLQASAPPAPDRTGIVYDAQQPGWGLSIYTEGQDRGALIYYYGGDGSPRWALGLGDNRLETETVGLLSFRGFCPDCPAIEPVASSAGPLSWRFAGARALSVDTDVVDPAGGARWQRNQRALTPLSDPVDDPRWK